MDDDASLEVESIKRTYQILSFAEKENTSVGAALFSEERPDSFIERGAKLDDKFTWFAKFRDTNATNIIDVLNQEIDETENDYNGWWFNAFPIKYAEKLVLPYFVRGDDVSFGPLNDFNIVLGNGIAAIAENFEYKVSAMTEYLDTRNKLIVHSLFINKPNKTISRYVRLILDAVMGGRYGYAAVYRKALKDFLHLTPEWLIENEKMQNIIPRLKELVVDETPQEIDITKIDYVQTNSFQEDSKSTRWRRLTINNLFFPLNSKQAIIQPFTQVPVFRQISGYRKILYMNPETGKGFVAHINRWKTISILTATVFDSIKLLFRYRAVRNRLKKQMALLTSEEMWNDILKIQK
jgi:hypothetical protein